MRCERCPMPGACAGESHVILCQRYAVDPTTWLSVVEAWTNGASTTNAEPILEFENRTGSIALDCPHRKPLPPELRGACSCWGVCNAGQSQRSDAVVARLDCEMCAARGGPCIS